MDTRRIAKISMMVALTIMGSYITVPLPSIPFTLQTLFALLAGLLLPRRDALISQLIYITLGLIGLPVFAGGGAGIAYVLRPSFGYILCMPLLAFVVSSLKHKNIYLVTYLSMIGLLVIGGIWMVLVAKMYVASGVGDILLSVFLLYVPIELLKGTLGIIIWKRIKNIL